MLCGGVETPRCVASGCWPLEAGLIKRLKGVWWMPWHREAMKDVVRCEKPWGVANKL